MTDTTQWVTRPRWTRAHALEETGSMGAERYFGTRCGLDFPLVELGVVEPTPAPEDMQHCRHCEDVLAGKRV
ncbi:MAG TPA: hypothetical protein VGL02_32165 [Streptomyces sp.]